MTTVDVVTSLEQNLGNDDDMEDEESLAIRKLTSVAGMPPSLLSSALFLAAEDLPS